MLTIDGQPQLRDVEGHSGLKHVVNSAFMIVLSGPNYYLYAGNGQWYASTQVMGPWQFTQSGPSNVQTLAPIEEEQAAREEAAAAMEEVGEEVDPGSPSPPAIVVATEPTELIVTEGAPDYKPVGSELLYISNTESDVLMEIATQRHFVLLSGTMVRG